MSPPRLELNLDGGRASGAVRLYNFGDNPVGVRVTTANWDLDEQNRVRQLPPTEQSLDQWMVLNPLRFVVEPGTAQVVRFSVRPRVEPESGEHRAMIYFEQDEAVLDSEESGMKVLFRVGVAVYAYSGEIHRAGDLMDVTIEGQRVRFEIAATGNAHVRLNGQYAIWPADAYPGADTTVAFDEPEVAPESPVVARGLLPEDPVLPGTRRTIEIEVLQGLPPGEFVLDLNGALGDTDVDRGVAFSVAPEPAADETATPARDDETEAADTDASQDR